MQNVEYFNIDIIIALITYDATILEDAGFYREKKLYYRHCGNKSGREPTMAMMVVVRVAKLLECITVWSPVGDKRRPGNLAIVDYRHPEVALIEIMIGGLMWRAEDEEGRRRDG